MSDGGLVGGKLAYDPKQSSEKFAGKEIAFGDAELRVLTSRTEMACGHADGNCTSNDCKKPGGGGGCATCVVLEVSIPGTAQIQAVRYYSTAQYTPSHPDDYPTPHEVGPVDHAWALMEAAQQKASADKKIIYTTYHNRSHNRDRRAALEVDYTL